MVKGGVEIIVSAFRDPVFGVMISCGAGGGLTEVIDDVVLARAPMGIAGASSLLQRLRIVRNASKIDASARLESLAGYLAHFSEVVGAVPWRQFVIEINPVKWRGEGVTAVDGLILIEEP
jgi:acetyltransferase